MHIRVELNSGEVVVRTIGSDLRMDDTAVGLTTHLASRMEQFPLTDALRERADFSPADATTPEAPGAWRCAMHGRC